MKTVLKGCGDLLQTARKAQSGQGINESIECKLIVQALRLNTLSKLTYRDSSRFDALITDVFPGVEMQNIVFEHLLNALNESAVELNLIVDDNQVNRSIDFILIELEQFLRVMIFR